MGGIECVQIIYMTTYTVLSELISFTTVAKHLIDLEIS